MTDVTTAIVNVAGQTGPTFVRTAGAGTFADPLALATANRATEWNDAGGVNLTAGATSVQTSAIASAAVRLAPQVAIWYAVGANPTAVSAGASRFLGAGAVEEVALQPGQKVAVLQASAGGLVNIVPAK